MTLPIPPAGNDSSAVIHNLNIEAAAGSADNSPNLAAIAGVDKYNLNTDSASVMAGIHPRSYPSTAETEPPSARAARLYF